MNENINNENKKDEEKLEINIKKNKIKLKRESSCKNTVINNIKIIEKSKDIDIINDIKIGKKLRKIS